MAIVKLVSSDKKRFEVDVKAASFSELIKGELLKLGETEAEEIPVDNVSGVILEKIIEWTDYHKDDPGSDSGAYVKSDWDEKFFMEFENKNDMLFDLVRATNTLRVEGLFDLACQAVGSLLNGKECSEIRELFGIIHSSDR